MHNMANPYFEFKQFTVFHDRCAMKVTTDACLFGAWCASEIKETEVKVVNALDIGAGTGLLSLMLAQQNNIEIDAVEIDEKAALQASENFESSPWKNRLKIIHGNILNLPLPRKYDCIISNPPFYENELQSGNALRNTAHHSHQLKLEELLDIINEKLEDNGLFYLLLPFKRQAETERLLQQKNLFAVKEVWVYPSTQHAPFRLLIKGAKKAPLQKVMYRLDIKNDSGKYTSEFIALLKEYYLYL